MKDQSKTKQVLIQELASLRQRIAELKQSESERIRTSEALRESEEQFRTIFDKASDGILIADPVTKKFLQGNTAICSMLGYTKEEIESLSIYDIHPPKDISHVLDEVEKQVKGEKVLAEDLPVLRKDGAIFYADISSSHATIGGRNCIVGVFRDITERKHKGKELRKLSSRQEAILAAVPAIIMEVDKNKIYTWANLVGIEFFGEDVIGKEAAFYFEGEQDTYEMVRPVFNGGEEIIYLESWQRRRDGQKRLLAWWCRVLKDEKGNVEGALSAAYDITDSKQAEQALQESEENYRNLFDHANEAIFVAQDGKLVFFNPMTTRIIGYSDEDLMSKSFVEFIHPDDRDMVIDRHVKRIKGEELPHIYFFQIIRRDGKAIWVELNTIVVNWKGKQATLNFLSDITERKHAEEKLQDTLESLRKAVGTTIQVLTYAVETRDPYTAGHQVRSADLARAIGTEMGLPQDKIDAIRITGSIHDIGKLSIPAEILSKPNKLSDIEFSLIKEHARKGYEMLKDVESPWPLAEIVYQHHERMDGSGYPRSLKGEAILIEARILGVADVVEAMASHRPYRPDLGIVAALNEIEKNRGTIYDNAVADACLRLFREKGFNLQEA